MRAVSAEHVRGVEGDMVLKPGIVIMAEPNPITPDGMFGIFRGHTFIVNDRGPRGCRCVSAGDCGRGVTLPGCNRTVTRQR
jgi:hypothetical protein